MPPILPKQWGRKIATWNQPDFGFAPEVWAAATGAIQQLREQLSCLIPISESALARCWSETERAVTSKQLPGLFGTSGLRALTDLTPNLTNFIERFTKQGQLTLIQVYCHGRAFGRFLRAAPPRSYHHRVFLSLDPRDSSPYLAVAIGEGLRDEGVAVYCSGVSSTPAALLFDGEPSIVITASHNSAQFNGIKSYLHHQPISLTIEEQLEIGLRTYDHCIANGEFPESTCDRAFLFDAAQDTARRYYQGILERYNREGLLSEQAPPIGKGRKVVLDLAHGVAAAELPSNWSAGKLSSLLRIHLAAGYAVIGYAAERNPLTINEGTGAAYMYGETNHACPREQIIACAEGKPGYGVVMRTTGDGRRKVNASPRSFYFPASWELRSPLAARAIRIENCYAFPSVDQPPWDDVRAALEAELAELVMDPGVGVDCDVDRITNFTVESARNQDTPYLSGDAYLAIFCYYLRARITKVFFTVESSMFLEKYCSLLGIPYEVVTVGDRALSLGLNEEARRLSAQGVDDFYLIGAESSGHVMVFEAEKGRSEFFDDPIITDAMLKGIQRRLRRGLDELLAATAKVYPELVCIRKPDAWVVNNPQVPNQWTPSPEALAQGPLSLEEKEELLLSRRGAPTLTLTDYAKEFIPWYIKAFSDTYQQAFLSDQATKSIELPGFEQLCTNPTISVPRSGYLMVDLGEIRFEQLGAELNDTLTCRLRLTADPGFGPFDITLDFGRYFRFSDDQRAGVRWYCVGRGTFRNSGTSPKNSGYHNLDLFSFALIQAQFGVASIATIPVLRPYSSTALFSESELQSPLSNNLLRTLLTELAVRRAIFTNEWVQTKLRHGSIRRSSDVEV